MSEEKKGGPAFPSATPKDLNFDHGMTIRDYFAAKAMHGLLTTKDYHLDQSADNVAVEAYHIADAMLAERSKI